MKALLFLATLLVGALAGAAEPTDASIRELMLLGEARKPLDTLLADTEQAIEIGMRQNVFGTALTLEDQVIIDNGIKRMLEAIRSELSWERQEQERIEVYKRAFSQAEVDAMIAFYRTPAGKAFVAKMPAVKQEDLKISMRGYDQAFARLEQIKREVAASLRSARGQ